MVAFTVKGFAGENRALRPTLLPPPVGVVSLNQKPGRGDLRPWKSPSNVATVPASRRTIYRMGRDVASASQYWLSWPTVVHAVTGLIADDTTERTYYTGDGPPKVTDNIMGLSAPPYPTSNRPLGLPRPAAAPTVTPLTTGVSATEEAYFYVYTYVNDWGWESATSPVSTVSVRKIDGTSTIGGFSAVPAGNYNVTLIRVYRSQSTSSGGTVFLRVAQIAVGTSTVVDNNPTLGGVVETATWLPAPDDLKHLTALWNGMLAGISNGAVRFCEPDVPYAWPPTYEVLPPDSKPVALGVFGQNLVILTNNQPLLAVGSTPDSMDSAPIQMSQACVAPDSVVSMGSGVAWASEDGLCWYGDGGGRVLTAGCMRREDWQALGPASIIGCMYEGLYFGSYLDGVTRKGFIVDPEEPNSILFLEQGYAGMHIDALQDQLFVLNGVNVQKWDAGTAMTYRFRSKPFTLPAPSNLSCAQVVADSYPVTLRVYADGVLRHTQTVANRRGFRLPSGFLADEWQVEVEGTVPVESITVASSMAELAVT